MEVSMRPKMLLAAVALGAVVAAPVVSRVFAQPVKLDTAAIEQATGLKGQLIADENVFKVTKPRTDVKIQVDQWTMPPFMGLGSWAAFTPAHGSAHVMMMGDTVVFEDEVNPAMSAAFEAGLEVTALHNHFFFEQPKVYFMHIGGTGEPGKLAAGVKKVYDKIAEIRAANPVPSKAFTGSIASPSTITAAPLEAALGMKGQANEGMFKIVIGRPATMHGVSVGKEMGINTWAAFGGSDDAAVMDGDFAMTENELQPVLRAMRKEGINIVAIHQHMSHEQPRYLFLHYWSKGKAASLAQSLKRVLDTQAAVKS
jgi:shikimate kinase